MGRETAIIIFKCAEKNIEVDMEIPLDITVMELFVALNTAYVLGADISDTRKWYLKAENPIALLRGNKTLHQCGIRNGSIINYAE